jgi:nucleosome binding factor SPN SPT16 subunit
MDLAINKEKFTERLEKLQNDWQSKKSTSYNLADALCIPLGTAGESIYSKSSSFHLYFFGNEELTDSVIIITKNTFYFMSSTKKVNFVKGQLGDSLGSFNLIYLERTKDEGLNRENFNKLMNAVRKGNGKKLGSFFKDKFNGSFMSSWMEFVESSQIEKSDVTAAFGTFFAMKDEQEIVSFPSRFY